MQESFLHYIWQQQYLSKENLRTSTGESVNILHPGIYNSNAGPDFIQTRTIIGEVEWHGCTEIHLKSSDWNNHQHQHDEAYNNVVLHVVWENDKPVFNSKGAELPTIELKDKVDEHLIKNYGKLINNPSDIPCAPQISKIQNLTFLSMLDKVLLERVQYKALVIRELLIKNQFDWEYTTYQVILKNFGFKVNAQPFLQLSQSLPLKVIQKHSDSLLQIEALLFGVAGFLSSKKEDSYQEMLQREYSFLSHKYDLAKLQMDQHQWKFLRLRPANFPTIRIAQLAALLHKSTKLFSIFREARDATKLIGDFSVDQSTYWKKHYNFGKRTSLSVSGMGKSSMENLIINSAVPILALYAMEKDDQETLDRALNIIQQLPAESNKITRRWQDLNMSIKNAFDSQGYIELYNSYCLKRRCLQCKVGHSVLKR